MPYHMKQRDPYARWHRPAYDMCHQCFRKWEKKELDERFNRGIAGLERHIKQAQERAADLTFKVWGIVP